MSSFMKSSGGGVCALRREMVRIERYNMYLSLSLQNELHWWFCLNKVLCVVKKDFLSPDIRQEILSIIAWKDMGADSHFFRSIADFYM